MRISDWSSDVCSSDLLAGRMTADQDAKQSEWVKAEREALKAKLPEWSDPKVAEPEQKMIAEYLLAQGYAQEEVQMLQDHRALIIARDAAKYRQLQAAKAKKRSEEGRGGKEGVSTWKSR